MNGRVYDPVIGRFLSPDPLLQNPENTQNYNRYSYVLNNPMNMVDPSGYAGLRVEEGDGGGGPDSGLESRYSVSPVGASSSVSLGSVANLVSGAGWSVDGGSGVGGSIGSGSGTSWLDGMGLGSIGYEGGGSSSHTVYSDGGKGGVGASWSFDASSEWVCGRNCSSGSGSSTRTITRFIYIPPGPRISVPTPTVGAAWNSSSSGGSDSFVGSAEGGLIVGLRKGGSQVPLGELEKGRPVLVGFFLLQGAG